MVQFLIPTPVIPYMVSGRKVIRIILLAAIAVQISLLSTNSFKTSFFGYHIIERLELSMMDHWFRKRGQLPAPEDIVIIAIDKETYDKLNISAHEYFPRKLYAKILNTLAEENAKAAAIDIMFMKESPDPEADQMLADAIGELPAILSNAELTRSHTTPVSSSKGERKNYLLKLNSAPMFEKNAAAIGDIIIESDSNIVRRFPGFITVGEDKTEYKLSLAHLAARTLRPKSPLPTGRDFINYYGPAGSINTIPAWKLISPEEKLPIDLLKNKLAFIGLKHEVNVTGGGRDAFITPASATHVFGVEIHATAAANILQGNWIKRLPSLDEKMLLGIIVAIAVALILLLPPVWGFYLTLILGFGWVQASYYLFLNGWYIPGLIPSIALLPALYLSNTFFYYVRVRDEERQVRSAFSRYLAPELVKRMVKEPARLKQGGELLKVTVMFSDIAGFASLAEKSTPLEITNLLNNYFNAMGKVIIEEQGMLINFMGDGMMALWGAPSKLENREEHAARTALRIQSAVDELVAANELPPLKTRLGIATGECMVGNLGTEDRVAFTAIGDSVNLASRLEELNKDFGTSILMDERAAEGLKFSDMQLLPIGKIRVRGKTEKTSLTALLEDHISNEIVSIWKEALNLFYQKDWDRAEESFKEAASQDFRLRSASELFIVHCHLFKRSNTPKDWEGEFIFRKEEAQLALITSRYH